MLDLDPWLLTVVALAADGRRFSPGLSNSAGSLAMVRPVVGRNVKDAGEASCSE